MTRLRKAYLRIAIAAAVGFVAGGFGFGSGIDVHSFWWGGAVFGASMGALFVSIAEACLA